MTEPPRLSLVIPLYNESENILPLYRELCIVLQHIPLAAEMIFIDDGSYDNSFATIKHLGLSDTRIRGISLSRNFGHQVALTAGLQQAKGEVIVRVDGHTEIAPDYVEQCVSELKRTEADNVGGKMTAIGNGAFGTAVALATSSFFGERKARPLWDSERGLFSNKPLPRHTLREGGRLEGGGPCTRIVL